MKAILASAASLALLAVAATPAAASDGPDVRVKNAVARMVVIVEDRADIAVEIEPGAAGLPAPRVTRRGNDVRIEGELGRGAIRNCEGSNGPARQPGEGATVQLRRQGRMNMSAAPLIVVRTPRDVDVSIEGGAVFGAVGRGASSISLGNGGCGDWTVANTDGRLELSLAGSGDMWAGTSGALEVSLAGSGNIATGATRDLEAAIAGSGNITVARVDGPVEASIAGSGNVTVRGGGVGAVEASIAGSGDVRVEARVASVEANVVGSGDVYVQAVSGTVSQSVMGSGRLHIGQ